MSRLYEFTSGTARALVAAPLAERYSVEAAQRVVSVTNRLTLEQAWFNEARTRKPQTFTQRQASLSDLDPTGGGERCDFCAWRDLTASDEGFGRIELRHAVTGSNLFKCCEPGHGIVLFKSHDPLAFDHAQLSDLLDASWLWMVAAAERCAAAAAPQSAAAPGMVCEMPSSLGLGPTAYGSPDVAAAAAPPYPFLLWNCLPRAGASQFHGHAQVVLSRAPMPYQQRLWQAAAQHARVYTADASSSASAGAATAGAAAQALASLPPYYRDLVAAHDAVGLARAITLPAAAPAAPAQGLHTAWVLAHLAPVKDAEVMVVGSHLGCPAVKHALLCALRALIDRLGVQTFNAGVLNLDVTVAPPADSSLWAGARAVGVMPHVGRVAAGQRPGAWPAAPVLVRIVGRGKLGNAASDFGCLEVFGGASIGHTDPFVVMQALEAQLALAVGCR